MNNSILRNSIFLILLFTLFSLSAKSIDLSETNINSDPPKIFLQVQDSVILWRIETRDGNSFVGEIVEQDAEKIIFNTSSYATITILKTNLKSIERVNPDNIKDNIYWADHMQSTRYFWQPSGYGLKKGEAYYQNVWILFNQFSVGVTDNFLLGGGIVPLFLFAGSPTPVWLTPKVSIPIKEDKLNLGVGGLFATVLGEEDTNFGILYGTITIGSKDKNVSFGAGYGYAGSDWATMPTFSLSVLHRTGSKGYFIMENYVVGIDGEVGVLSMIGGRRIIGQHSGLDFGVVIPMFPDQGVFLAIPWLGITIPFGSNP